MRTSNFLPIFGGLGNLSAGLNRLINENDSQKQGSKTSRLFIDDLVIDILTRSTDWVDTLDDFTARRSLIESLASILAIESHYSVAASELFEIIIPAITNTNVIFEEVPEDKEPSFLYSIYKELEDRTGLLPNTFFENAAILVRNYYYDTGDWLEKWITSLAEVVTQQGKEDGLFSKIVYAIMTDTEHEEIFARSMKILAQRDEHLPIYWRGVVAALRSGKTDNVTAATSFIIKEGRYTSVKPLSVENIILDGQDVINTLTWGHARQQDFFLNNTDEVEFFCMMTSKSPRQQLLDAWKRFEPEGKVTPKILRALSKRAEQKLPKKEGDPSVEVTVENFSERFPLITSEKTK